MNTSPYRRGAPAPVPCPESAGDDRSRPQALRLAELQVEPSAFQPRGQIGPDGPSEDHVNALLMALRNDGKPEMDALRLW